ncbi:hypothetical protein EAG08_19520 [Chryseobacterium sp. 3008163]|nr:hypothetical protein EAG08_19520 [Chryseobacterium sp. 3008163]
MPNISSQVLKQLQILNRLLTLINVKIAARLERKSFLFLKQKNWERKAEIAATKKIKTIYSTKSNFLPE